VHTSTSEVYGTALYAPIDEKHPLQAQSPYSASKIGADMIADSFYRSFGLPVSIARPFNTYGPRQSARAVLPAAIVQLAAGRPRVRLGDLTPVRDLQFRRRHRRRILGDRSLETRDRRDDQPRLGPRRRRRRGRGDDPKSDGNGRPVVRDGARLRPKKSEVYKLICDNRKARRLTVGARAIASRTDSPPPRPTSADRLSDYKPDAYNL